MALTPANSWPYAGPNDSPDVPYWQQRQAEKGDGLETRVIATEKFAKGLVLLKKITTNSGAIGTAAPTTIVENVPTFTFKAGRAYAIEWRTSYTTSAGGSYWGVAINTCSTTDLNYVNTGLTQITSQAIHTDAANLGDYFVLTSYLTPTVDTTLQIKFSLVWAGVGAGTLTIAGSTSSPTYYTITDLGQQL